MCLSDFPLKKTNSGNITGFLRKAKKCSFNETNKRNIDFYLINYEYPIKSKKEFYNAYSPLKNENGYEGASKSNVISLIK